MILFYLLQIQSKSTWKNTHPVTSMFVTWIFVLWLYSLLENALSNDLFLTDFSIPYTTFTRRCIDSTDVSPLDNLLTTIIKDITTHQLKVTLLRYRGKMFPNSPKGFDGINIAELIEWIVVSPGTICPVINITLFKENPAVLKHMILVFWFGH